jgi:hypothetical protein
MVLGFLPWGLFGTGFCSMAVFIELDLVDYWIFLFDRRDLGLRSVPPDHNKFLDLKTIRSKLDQYNNAFPGRDSRRFLLLLFNE